MFFCTFPCVCCSVNLELGCLYCKSGHCSCLVMVHYVSGFLFSFLVVLAFLIRLRCETKKGELYIVADLSCLFQDVSYLFHAQSQGPIGVRPGSVEGSFPPPTVSSTPMSQMVSGNIL